MPSDEYKVIYALGNLWGVQPVRGRERADEVFEFHEEQGKAVELIDHIQRVVRRTGERDGLS